LRSGGYCKVVDISKAGRHLAPTGYVAETCPNRLAQAKEYVGDDALPGKAWCSAFLSRRPKIRRFKAARLEEARATAASSEAVEKYCATLTSVLRQYEITSAAQDFNTDKSMNNTADVQSSCTKHMYTTSPFQRRPDFVNPFVQSGPEAASLVACICAEGSPLPLFAVVRGSGGHLPYFQETCPDDNTNKVPLTSYLGVGAEARRRDNPGFDKELWIEYARFLAKNLGSTQPTEGGTHALKHLPTTHVQAHQRRKPTHPMPIVLL